MVIPLSPEWKILGIQISGGMDSALVGYVAAKTIQDKGLNIRILPISHDVASKPPSLPVAHRVIDKLRELTGPSLWLTPFEYTIPLSESRDPLKREHSIRRLKELRAQGIMDYCYNGVNKNPPRSVMSAFKYFNQRQVDRDDPASLYWGKHGAKPLAFCDKQGVVELYKIFGIYEELLPLTVSCDVELKDLKEKGFPCGVCWWCQERHWGIQANDEGA